MSVHVELEFNVWVSYQISYRPSHPAARMNEPMLSSKVTKENSALSARAVDKVPSALSYLKQQIAQRDTAHLLTVYVSA